MITSYDQTRPFNKLLASLPADDFERLRPHLSTVPLAFKQVLHKQGARIRNIYFPGGGACSVTKVMANGQSAEIATIGNEGVVGASVFFGDDQSIGDTLIQVEDGEGYMMGVEPFMVEMEQRGHFYNRVVRYYQALMTQVMQTTVCNGLHSVEQRCCRWLLMTHDRVPRTDLRLTHEFLAIMLGVRRPTVTLTAGALQRAGLIDCRRGYVTILDRPGLEAISCECYGTVKANFARLLPEFHAEIG
jgi:CRP-like cAMP-binding protein